MCSLTINIKLRTHSVTLLWAVMLATMTLSGLGEATALKVPFQNFSKSCFCVQLCDPRDGAGPQGPSWSEHGGCIWDSCPHQTVFSPSPDRLSTHLWKCTLTLVVALELSKYWIKLNRAQQVFSLLSPLTAAGQCVTASVCSTLLSGSFGRETKADPLQLEAGYCSPRWGKEGWVR